MGYVGQVGNFIFYIKKTMLKNLSFALSAIQNGYSGKCYSVPVPRTFLNYVVLNHLYEAGYIGGFQVNPNNEYKFSVELKYMDFNEPALKHFKIISKHSQRIFMSAKELQRRFSIHDFVLIQSSLTRLVYYNPPILRSVSAPSARVTGVITLKESINFRYGGEVLLSIL
jgi:ribosomal protein S8